MKTPGLAKVASLLVMAVLFPSDARATLPTNAEVESILRAQLIDKGLAKGVAAALVDLSGIRVVAVGEARDGIKLTPDHQFEIGSVTKTFAGTLLALAEERGELKVTDPVEKYLPEGLLLRDKDGVPVQLVDLATHRSGLPRLASNMAPKDPKDPYADYSEADLFDFLRHFKPVRARNAQFEYSNIGFGLLGIVLARAAKAPDFATLVDMRVFQPLGMTHSTANPAKLSPTLAQPYDSNLKPTPAWSLPNAHAAAGAIRATPGDMGRYVEAIAKLKDTPLNRPLSIAATARESGPGRINPIGFAFIRVPFHERGFINHDGATFGSSASLMVDPEAREGVFLVSNTSVPLTEIAIHLLDKRMPLKPKDFPKVVDVAPATLASYTGIYKLAEGFNVEVRMRGEKLTAQATGQGEFEIFAESPTRFFAKVAPLSMTFGEVRDGKAREFILEQGGGKRSAKRID